MEKKYSKNVGREMVEKAGVNVDLLIDKLKKAAAAEFTTYYYYTLLRMHCKTCLKVLLLLCPC